MKEANLRLREPAGAVLFRRQLRSANVNLARSRWAGSSTDHQLEVEVIQAALRKCPAYPLLFTVAVLFQTYVAGSMTVPAVSLLRPALIGSVAVAIIMVAIARPIGLHAAGLGALIVPMSLTEFGPAPDAQVLIVITPLLIGLTAVLLGRIRSVNHWPALTGYLNVMATILLAFPLVSWVSSGGPQQLALEAWPPPPRASAEVGGDEPSIYIIMLDGYPRADTLRDHLDFDNTLIPDLGALGFDHYPDARTNYPNTTLTTATMFNMAYLEDLPGLISGNEVPAPRQPRYRNAISDGAAFEVARELGYEVIAIESGWDELALTGADRLVRTDGLNQFEEALLRYSALGPILDIIAPDIFGDHRRTRIEQGLEQVATVAEGNAGQRLVFAHIPGPHFPLVYGKDGSPLVVERHKLGWFDLNDPRLHERYRDNLTYLNSLVISAVDRIVVADPGAVVVLMSDHGSLLDLGDTDERIKGLLLARTPEHYRLLGDRPTPVNLFPLLFNAYSNTTLPIRPDRSFQIAPGGLDWTLVPVP